MMTRRAFTGGAVAVLAVVPAAADVSAPSSPAADPDAEILAAVARWRALEAAIDAETERRETVLAKVPEREREIVGVVDPRGAHAGRHDGWAGEVWSLERFRAAETAYLVAGLGEIDDRLDALLEEQDPLTDRLRAARPATLRGELALLGAWIEDLARSDRRRDPDDPALAAARTALDRLQHGGDNDALLTRAEAAAFLAVSPRSLECGGLDVPFVRLTERMVRYRVGDLRAFVAGRRTGGAAARGALPSPAEVAAALAAARPRPTYLEPGAAAADVLDAYHVFLECELRMLRDERGCWLNFQGKRYVSGVERNVATEPVEAYFDPFPDVHRRPASPATRARAVLQAVGFLPTAAS